MLSESLATEDLPSPSLGLQEDGFLERHDRITFIKLKEFIDLPLLVDQYN